MPRHQIDLNGDGTADLILQDESTGYLTTLLMQNDVPFNVATYSEMPTTSKVAAFGDFDGSGTTDLFWHDLSSGAATEWLMGSNGIVEGTQSFSGIPASYDVVGSGDYNADGKSDLLWRGEFDGQLTMWQMNGTSVASSVSLGTIPTSYSVVDGSSDFTGDGKSDILFHGMDDGQTTLWAMNGSQIEQRFNFGQIPTNLSILDTHGDLNGDGTNDILWYDHNNGNVVEWLMHDGQPSSTAVVGTAPSSAMLISAAGDYNGDGISDMLWDVNGKLVIWTMNTQGGIFSVDYVHDSNGNPMQLSATDVVEDAVDSLDGSGHSSVVVRDTSDGATQVWAMNGPEVTSVTNLSAGSNSVITNGNGSGVVINADLAQNYYGTDGNDTFVMQSSGATVTGGAGDNIFHVSNFGGTITDFKPNADQIVLDHGDFTVPFGGPVYNPGIVGFTSGTSGPAGADGRYQFYYQTNTGQLWYAEPFGSVANEYVVIATLQNHPTLSNHDILLV